eukprot:Gb_28390 [translate_table: standard]
MFLCIHDDTLFSSTSAMATMELTPPFPPSSSFDHKFKNQSTFDADVGLNRETTSTAAAVKIQSTLKSNWKSQGNNANTLYREALLKNPRTVYADSKTYVSLLQACSDIKALMQVHSHMVRSGFDQNIFLATKLVSIYIRCGSMEFARLIFDKIHRPNIFLWTVMIRGYATNGPFQEAITLYYQMQRARIKPDKLTFPFVLKACGSLTALQEGKEIHDDIVRTGFESDVFVGNSLVTMYAKCGRMEFARQLFDKMSKRNVVSWNAMIAGYARSGHANEAMALFQQMKLAEMKPNAVTMVIVLQACAHSGDLHQGRWIHEYIIQNGFESDASVGNSLLAMYAKCRNVEIARQLFDKMSERNVISWNAMIAGYSQNGHASDALKLFNEMQLADIKPDLVTVMSVLPAFAHLAALQQAKGVHAYIIRSGFELDVFVGTALVDMYSKCGSLEVARLLFDKMSERNVVTWSAMILAYGMHGHGEDALALFNKMQQTGTKPNDITFICVLSACSHAGLVDEGWQCFDSMSRDHCIRARVEHYACMVDLLGRAGHLDEAQALIKKMPVEPDATVWGALLGACRINCNVELGEVVAKRLFNLEPKNVGCYVLLSNIYAAAGRWNDVEKVRKMMRDRGLKKTPGCSLIEVNNGVQAFYVGDRSHPQSEKIYATLETLSGQIEAAGFVPNIDFVLHDVEDEVKEHMLCIHSEKLAIAFGLFNTSPRNTIRITKNLRMCGDCHSAIMLISKIVSREIIVRDANRFHRFKDGSCSCGNYW